MATAQAVLYLFGVGLIAAGAVFGVPRAALLGAAFLALGYTLPAIAGGL